MTSRSSRKLELLDEPKRESMLRTAASRPARSMCSSTLAALAGNQVSRLRP